MTQNKTDTTFEVLSPWAEADPVALKSLSPRVDKLDGKKNRPVCNSKRAAPPILDVTEKLLKEKYPSVEVSRFNAKSFSVSSLEKERAGEFNDWIKGVDAVIAAVGD